MMTVLIKRSESWAGIALGVIVLVSALAFPVVEALSRRFGKATVFRWGGLGYVVVFPLMAAIGLGPVDPLVAGLILFTLAGLPTATLLVLPRTLLADVIDQDERLTGLRREAMYNGMSGFFEKLADMLAFLVSAQLFEHFGYSSGEPLGIRLVGPTAAAFVVIGLIGFRRYRLR
jgi:GPH family glycoside/pentoside/hexuronide:cation symporter